MNVLKLIVSIAQIYLPPDLVDYLEYITLEALPKMNICKIYLKNEMTRSLRKSIIFIRKLH